MKQIAMLYRIAVWLVIAASSAFALAIFADILLGLHWGYQWRDLAVAIIFVVVSLGALWFGKHYFGFLDRVRSR